MKLSTAAFTLMAFAGPVRAFMPAAVQKPSFALRMGYLDELNKQVGYDPDGEEEEDDSRDSTKLSSDKVDRGGVGDWSQFVDFNGEMIIIVVVPCTLYSFFGFSTFCTALTIIFKNKQCSNRIRWR